MGTEIERKFLVDGDGWRGEVTGAGMRIRQGYVETGGGVTVRVRTGGGQGWLTVKGPTLGLARSEFEYRIPVEDAEAMMEGLCGGGVVEKVRYRIDAGGGRTWEVDAYEGENAPLVTAEIELGAEGEAFGRPPWLGREVSGEARFRNSELAARPFGTWDD